MISIMKFIFRKRGRKKKKSLLFNVIKWMVYLVGGFSLMIILFEGIDSFTSFMRNDGGYVTLVQGQTITPELVDPNGAKVNGLNLLLINNINTEGYVKEYLNLMVSLQEGLLGPQELVGVNVQRMIGIGAIEQGTYTESGFSVMGSPLPWSSMTNSPVWDSSKKWTLNSASNTTYSSELVAYEKFVRGTNSTGTYIGAFQVEENSYKSSPPSSLNGTGHMANRGSDAYYFPDQLYISAKVLSNKNQIYTAYLENGMEEETAYMLGSIAYSGTSMMQYPYLAVTDSDSINDMSSNANLLYSFSQKIIHEYGFMLNGLASPPAVKFLMLPATIKEGAKISQEGADYATGNSYQRQYVQMGMDLLGITDNIDTYVQNAVDTSLPYLGNYSGRASIVLGGKKLHYTPESFFHYISEEVFGGILYANMLKFAGVGVDPTDPSTYMNQFQDEWLPSGNSAWMSDYKFTAQDIGPKRTSILNYAFTLTGIEYTQAAIGIPPKDSSGNWMNDPAVYGFDCSSLIQHVYKEILNIDVGRNTSAQIISPNTYVITKEEAKPGDLVYYYTAGGVCGHASFYLEDFPAIPGWDRIFHAPYEHNFVGPSQWDGSPEYAYREYRRVKGME